MSSFFANNLTAISADACRFMSNCPSRGPEKKTFIFYNPKIIKRIISDNIKNALSHTASASHNKILMPEKKTMATVKMANVIVISSIQD